MTKKIVKSKKGRKESILVYITASFLLCVIGYTVWELNVPAQIIPVNLSEIGLIIVCIMLLVPVLIKGMDRKNNRLILVRYAVPFMFFVIALCLGLASLSPARKTIVEAERLLEQQHSAVDVASAIAERVEEGTLSKDEAVEEIKNTPSISEENWDLANAVLEEQNLDPVELQKKLVPTIPLSYMKWNCNKYGCALIDDTYVWQLSRENRVLGTLAVLLSLGAMMWMGWSIERKGKSS